MIREAAEIVGALVTVGVLAVFPGWLAEQGAESLTLSWQTLAAMVTISSMLVGVATVYLRLFVGNELTRTTFEIIERVREDIEKAVDDRIEPVEKRVERLEDDADHAR